MSVCTCLYIDFVKYTCLRTGLVHELQDDVSCIIRDTDLQS
jgi:hypothetical protein